MNFFVLTLTQPEPISEKKQELKGMEAIRDQKTKRYDFDWKLKPEGRTFEK